MKLLTDREKKLLEAMSRASSIKNAAYLMRQGGDPSIQDEDMTDDAAYAIIYRLKRKYLDSRTFINTILAYRKRSDLHRRALTPSRREEEGEI